ncbi:MAG TPA: purine-nucleoside phosphorylase [Spirochaetota bacterium]|nr:purine-nucleoside phosphorylase [Spirochaetota bacterium]HPN81774.1 purine-nucleoside phosphorylase [Spirochaetota bacterium]
MNELEKKIDEASSWIKARTKHAPVVGLILGSGLGAVGDIIEHAEYFPYKDIPGFPVSTVEGHAGRLVVGKLEGKDVVAMQGRFHFYEGYSMAEVTFPVRVMKRLGVKILVVTNAAGAVNKGYTPGDLVLITDHINFQGTNALIGHNLDSFGPRFPDMSTPYDSELGRLAKETAFSLGFELREGVYAAMSGPSYETPAEVRMVRTLGGDAVGMSTVPEVVVANHCGMRVLGISCMTNMAAGVLDQPLNHEEVIETSNQVRDRFIKLMLGIVKNA